MRSHPQNRPGSQRHRHQSLRQVRLMRIPNYAQDCIDINLFCVCFLCLFKASDIHSTLSDKASCALRFPTSRDVGISFAPQLFIDLDRYQTMEVELTTGTCETKKKYKSEVRMLNNTQELCGYCSTKAHHSLHLTITNRSSKTS